MSESGKSTIYLITYHKFNHEGQGRLPLDERFLRSSKNYIYYLIDTETPERLQGKAIIKEKELDSQLFAAGSKYFAEWSFLLAEEKHAFCQYPFFMISSRFYEKNHWLTHDLNHEWDNLFAYLDHYGWGFLPSYDRPIRWIDLLKEQKKKEKYGKHVFFPFKPKCFQVLETIYGANLCEYRYIPDLFCNYIGFKTRAHLLEYVKFYRKLIEFFFDEQYQPKVDLESCVAPTGIYRNEKSFTFILEFFSHLFFYGKNLPYFALHYDGYYEIQPRKKAFLKLHAFSQPFFPALIKHLRWQARRIKTESGIAKMMMEKFSSLLS